MEKILDFKKDGKTYTVLTDGISQKEIHVDGAYEVFIDNGMAKIRFYSTVSSDGNDHYIVENNSSLVLSEPVLKEFAELLSKVCKQENDQEVESTPNPNDVKQKNSTEQKYTKIADFS